MTITAKYVVRARPASNIGAATFLQALCVDLSPESLHETPARMARPDADLLTAPECRSPTGSPGNWSRTGVGVVIEAEHLRMTLRGVQAAGARTTASTMLDVPRDDARYRGEFLAAAGLGGR
ncbi:GTP cyclohydrolase I [Micromonospora sp. NPDC000442]|uniref:GTP cyclohydrolase I n=1 Tax=Micromonospora sp. NPDC000442 TaxID=3364217 RepID=UPI0036C66709